MFFGDVVDVILVYILFLLVGDDIFRGDENSLLMFIFLVIILLVNFIDLGGNMFMGYLELLLLLEGYGRFIVLVV